MSKSIKHHLANWETSKTLCGIQFTNESIRIAEQEDKVWYNDMGDELNTDNWQDVFCLNCLKLHELDLISEFKMRTFLIRYEMQLPKSNRAKRKKNCRTRINRIAGVKTESISAKLEKELNPPPIPKSAKGLAREKRKAQSKSKLAIQIKSNSLTNKVMELYSLPTEEKCRIVSKPKPAPKSKSIEKKPLIDLSKGPVTIQVEEINPIAGDNWIIGEPILDDTISELEINPNWKMVRHNKELNQWKLQFRNKVTKNKWIDDCEFVDYDTISEIINSGYCN